MSTDGSAALRVAILVDSLVVGGAERVVEALARRLVEYDVEVHVGCLRRPGPIGDALRDAGVPVTDGLAPSRIDVRQVRAVRDFFRSVQADVVLVLDHSNALFFGRLAARWCDLPAVVAVHRTRRADGAPSLGRIDRLLLPWTAAVIAVSEGHAAYLRDVEGIDASMLRVVHNGVDPGHFSRAAAPEFRAASRAALGLDDAGCVFGIVAALRPEKNHEGLLRALAAPALSDATLVVVGDGPRRQRLQALADSLGIATRVHWTGWKDDVVDVLASIDALVLPSHPNVETFPMCVLEAMAASRPVVATDVGSLDEMVVDGETGFLVPPGDDEALVRRLAALRDDPDARRRMGEAARKRLVDQFDEASMIEGVAGILREAVARHG